MSAFIKYINYLNSLNEFSIKKLYKKKSSLRWSKNLFKISDLNKMRCLKINMSTHEINKRVKAFHMEDYPVFFEIKGKNIFTWKIKINFYFYILKPIVILDFFYKI